MRAATLRPLALLLVVAPFAALAQTPVVDAYGNPLPSYGTAGGGYAAGTYQQPAQGYQSGYPAQQPQVSAQGELFLQIQQLQNEVQRLSGLVEEQQYQLQQLRQEGLDRYQDLDGRLQSLQSAPPAAQSPAPAASDAAAPAPSSAAGSDPAKEKLLYDASFDLVRNRDFEKADMAFTAFLRKYPSSQYAGNAQYWLGEVKLARGELQTAGDAFSAVITAYPQSSKVPDALYKLADVERRQGRPDQARQLLQQVITDHPKSSAAQLAQRELARL